MTHRIAKVRASELTGRSWLNTGGTALTLAELRGKIVILDFWTFCCINCLHVLDELRPLEEKYRDELIVIGVHSPKFTYEAQPDAVAAAVERYAVHHPVLDDPTLSTWSAYGARAWPTLVVIDPEGYIVAHMAGEGHGSALDALLDELVREHDARGTLHRGEGPYVPPAPTPGALRFPAAAVALPHGNYLVADAGHHQLTEVAADGQTLIRHIGTGVPGLVDGPSDQAQFHEPNGLCLIPESLRHWGDVLIADTVNHAIRALDLTTGIVRTIAGGHGQFMVSGVNNLLDTHGTPRTERFDPSRRYRLNEVRLTSPWDVVWSPAHQAFLIAMAGNHTVWSLDATSIGLLAGTMNEGLLDGPGQSAWFAQPSRFAVDDAGRVWLADSETSALRWLEVVDGRTTVHTAIGQGLFDFGHVDGPASSALLQHPLGVAVLPDGSVAVADTYNGAIRRFVPGVDDVKAGEVTTLISGLAEPSGVMVLLDGQPWQVGDPVSSASVHLVVVESSAHQLTTVAVPILTGERVDAGAHSVHRPATTISAGVVGLEVAFTIAPGQKLDDTYGPPVEVTVSSTPPELLLAGAGTNHSLAREITMNPAISHGVLHVTARVQSCDVIPEDLADHVFPACHLAQQDWGIPVRIAPDGVDRVELPLRG